MPRFAASDPELPLLVSRIEALRSGMTQGQVQQRLRSGAWERVAHGFYLRTAASNPELDPYAEVRVRHVRRAVGALRRNRGCAIGWQSAALLHGLPLFERIPDEVCLIAPAGHWTGRRSGIVFRASSSSFGITVEHPATTPARTWVDIARNLSLADALSVGDAAVRQGLVTIDDLAAAAATVSAGRGRRRLEIALGHVDARRETPLESGSWTYFVEQGLALPTPQVEYVDSHGRFVGRVDFAWRDRQVVGECDGRLKYVDAEELYAEKRREDALRALGLTVVRWGMADLRTGALAARLRQVLR